MWFTRVMFSQLFVLPRFREGRPTRGRHVNYTGYVGAWGMRGLATANRRIAGAVDIGGRARLRLRNSFRRYHITGPLHHSPAHAWFKCSWLRHTRRDCV